MPALTAQQLQVINNCKQSVSWFLRSCGWVKHPSAGLMKFDPFKYQRKAIGDFRKHRYNIFRKCRQCFRGDQPVWTPGGPVPIADITPGQPVYTLNPATGRLEVTRALELYDNGTAELCEVRSPGHLSVATADHQYFTGRGLRGPASFTPGEELLRVANPYPGARPALAPNVSVRTLDMVGRVYDLRVPPYDNYVVDGAVVHNCGVSKISGAYALWFAMFHAHKTVLIVSRTDPDAMNFLRENVTFLFRHLPEWMQELWAPVKDNEHEIAFPNGSRIRSLSSHPDVLRSNASSLNIIDEAAFIPNMDVMWSGGWSTLQHGGSIIVVSTTNGVGGWYWAKWMDAEAGIGEFNPIVINWWDMDWAIEYVDPASGKFTRISPTDGVLRCDNQRVYDDQYGELRLDPDKYGPYWSPWLESQWRELQERGEAWKFEQEVLASFVGSGNTVLSKSTINFVGSTLAEPQLKVTGLQGYVHPTTGELSHIDFTPRGGDDGLWIWKKPVVASPGKFVGGSLVEPGSKAHSYVIGVDIATGKGKDYHAIEVFDIDELEQVAEYMGHCLPREFKKIVDRVGRYYNCALAVVERNNGGDNFIDELRHDLMYPRIWRKKSVDDRPSASNVAQISLAPHGFFTTSSTKPTLNKHLLDFIRDREGEGYRIYSRRLHKQFQTYVRKKDKAGKDTGQTEAEDGAGNFDDLVIACALALVGAPDAIAVDATSLLPKLAGDFSELPAPAQHTQEQWIQQGGVALLMPVSLSPEPPPDISAQIQVDQFALQLGGIPIVPQMPVATGRRHLLDAKRQGGK